jgi:Domain of unknown function (DUF1844)
MTDRQSAMPAAFSGLVAGIAATTAGMLQEVGALIDGKVPEGTPGVDESGSEAGSPEPRAGAIRTGLANARHYIDTLAVLQQKTKGNLTQEEEQLLAGVLTDLKITFVKLNDRWTSTKGR